jgi:hypothetical protein
MAGTITTSTIQNDTSSPPTFRNNSVEIGTLCRAWVNFNGTGTVAIRSSFNVSSITDNGTGDYTVNFTTALPDANYSVGCFSHNTNDASAWIRINSGQPNGVSQLAGSFRIVTYNVAYAATDTNLVDVQFFR